MAKSRIKRGDTLNMIVDQEHFDEVMSGKRTMEVIDITPQNATLYIQHDKEGYIVEDENGNSIPHPYEKIHYLVGFRRSRDKAMVRIKSIKTELTGGTYIHEGREWLEEKITYELGETIKD